MAQAMTTGTPRTTLSKRRIYILVSISQLFRSLNSVQYACWSQNLLKQECTNHNPHMWPFEPVEVTFCSLGGPLGWLTTAKHKLSIGQISRGIEGNLKRQKDKTYIFWKMNKGMLRATQVKTAQCSPFFFVQLVQLFRSSWSALAQTRGMLTRALTRILIVLTVLCPLDS